ncbi:MAG: TRAP transporter small permease [Beijerinckiaceae bacterium]
MTDPELPVEAGGPATRRDDALSRATAFVAVCGGVLALAVAVLVTASVAGRWLFNAPIDGDFEFVKMATAVAIFSYLPFTQAQRGNIVVDTFTMGLTNAARRRIDAFWDLAYAAFTAFLAYALFNGTLDAIKSGETTMQRQLLVWPSIGVAMLLCAVLALTAALTAVRLLKQEQRTVRS